MAEPIPSREGESTWTDRRRHRFDLSNPYGDQR